MSIRYFYLLYNPFKRKKYIKKEKFPLKTNKTSRNPTNSNTHKKQKKNNREPYLPVVVFDVRTP
jgi:hypothetical protein